MGWILWLLLFAAVAADLVLLVLLLRMRDKMQKQQRTDHKALKREKQELTAIRRELCHERDIIGLIQEHMVEGILILDDSDKIQLANRTAVAQLRIADGEWENKSIFILTDNQDFLQALRQSKTGQNPPVRHLLKLEEKYIRAYIHRVEMGGIFGTIVLLVDVTYSVKAEKMRQEFTANVSHELKTPITSMKVLSESLLTQSDVPAEMYREFMEDIVQEIDREAEIISDLLTLVKTDKGPDSLNKESVDMDEFMDLILKRLRPIAATRNIELVYESFRPVTAEVDEMKISLAISNLVENAIKYNKENGWVHVSLNADHKNCYIEVADSGIGIPAEAQEHIFERFYRMDKSHSREIGGTGLGLAIARSAVVMHRGAIKVFSQPSEGTTFTVRIPLNYVS